jgi:hypothetical protein
MVHNQSLVIWKISFSRTKHSAGFPARGIWRRRLPDFSVAALRDDADPHTVTSSHRRFTCFPFTLCPLWSKGTDCFIQLTIL